LIVGRASCRFHSFLILETGWKPVPLWQRPFLPCGECAPENWQRHSAFTSFRRDRPRSPAVLAPVAAGPQLNRNAWHIKTAVPISARGTNQIRHGRLARVIAEDFTFANVARVAQAAADYWKSEVQSPKSKVFGYELKVVVGYDRRFCLINSHNAPLKFSPEIILKSSHAGADADAVGFVRRQTSARRWRGNDYRQPQSADFQRFQTQVGLRRLQRFRNVPVRRKFSRPQSVKTMPLADAIKAGRIQICDVRPAHYAALKKLVDFKLIAKSRLRFAHDALFGVGAGCFEQLLAGTTCKVTTLNGEHDVLFGGINPEPIEKIMRAARNICARIRTTFAW